MILCWFSGDVIWKPLTPSLVIPLHHRLIILVWYLWSYIDTYVGEGQSNRVYSWVIMVFLGWCCEGCWVDWSEHASFVQVNYSYSILSQSYFFSDSIWECPKKIFDFSLYKDKMIVLTNGMKHSLLWQWLFKWQIWNIGHLMSAPSSHLIFQDFEEETILHRSFFFPQLFSPRKNQCQNRLCVTFSWDVPNAELPCGKYDWM